eukprot:1391387-Pleurochrysis_carterae.AAC.2
MPRPGPRQLAPNNLAPNHLAPNHLAPNHLARNSVQRLARGASRASGGRRCPPRRPWCSAYRRAEARKGCSARARRSDWR